MIGWINSFKDLFAIPQVTSSVAEFLFFPHFLTVEEWEGEGEETCREGEETGTGAEGTGGTEAGTEGRGGGGC